jgi:hypothetical protein
VNSAATHGSSSAASPALVLVLATELDVGELFLDCICGKNKAQGITEIDGQRVHAEALDVESALEGVANEKLAKAKAVILLVHHLDLLSLNRIRLAHLKLGTSNRIKPHIVLFRRKGETEFKISCPPCEQKLLIRHSDVDRVGKCPHCQRPMRLPQPDVHLRTQLNLPKTATIHPVAEDQPEACRKIVSQLVHGPRQREDAFSTTMRIEILPEDKA